MFAHPLILHLLWFLPVLVLLRVWAKSAAARTAGSMVAERLRSSLVASASPVLGWLVFVLKLLALAGFIVALAQPRWGEEKRVITESGKNVLFAIDTSKSMLADDVQPNRLTRAKLAAQDIIETLREQRVGLIAFAGSAYLQAPLTTDHAAVIESIQSLDTFTIPKGGSSISEAINEALDAFGKTKARSHGLIIFSDGAEDEPALDSALAKAREQHVLVISIGVGTDTGALIPDPDPNRPGDYIRDPATNTPVHTKLEEATLQKLASSTGGRYLKLGAQSLTNGVVMQTLASLDTLETGNREESKLIERFYWPLGFGIVCLMLALALRPSARLPRALPALVMAACALLSPPMTRASVLSDSEAIREAKESYDADNFGRARDLYARLLADDPPPARAGEYAYGLGASTQRLEDYDRAIEAFSKALRTPDKDLQVRSHHSLGNTLYQQGAKALAQQPEFAVKAWIDSISHYESALKIHEDKAVRENMEFVKKHLEQVQQQQQQQKDKGKKDKQDKGEKGDKGDPQDGEGEGDEPKDKDGKDGKDSKQQDGEKKDGDQQKGGDQKDGDQKDGKQGKGVEEDGKDGQKPIPEGQVEANAPGDKKEEKEAQMMREQEAADGKEDQQTGFSRNEARALLRTYNDQMQMQFQQRRRESSVKRDW